MNQMPMRRIGQQYLEAPFSGVRQTTRHLRNAGHPGNETRLRRRTRLKGLMPMNQDPNASKAAEGHTTHRYVLRGLWVERPNGVRAADVICLPMGRGFPWPVANMDRHTRKVLARRIATVLAADVCVEALDAVVHHFGPPEIVNTDQGRQFPSFARIDRPWRRLKGECLRLHGWQTGSEARAGVGRPGRVPHPKNTALRALRGKSPAMVCWPGKDETDAGQQERRAA